MRGWPKGKKRRPQTPEERLQKSLANKGHPKSLQFRLKMTGRKLSDEHREKISKAKLGKKNPNWHGNKVGYNGVHGWVKRYLLKPQACQQCQKVKPLDLANKGEYVRDLDQWEWLCRSCHMKADGRLEKLIAHSKRRAKFRRLAKSEPIEP